MILFLAYGKVHVTKVQFFVQNGPPSFLDCFLTLAERSKKTEPGGPFKDFWEAKMGPGAHSRIKRPILEGGCCLCLRCRLCLCSVSWTCQMTCFTLCL